MPLTEQEARCVELVCEHLGSIHGGAWRITEYLNQLHLSTPTPPTPEVLVGNGAMTAAIEVKRLFGDSMYQVDLESYLSLKRSLVPSCGGYYFVISPVDLRRPLEKALHQRLKAEIERVAPSLSPGQHGPLLFLRKGYIEFTPSERSRSANCQHNCPAPKLDEIVRQIDGDLMLVDAGLEHSFVTDKAKEAFAKAILDAYHACRFGSEAPIEWNEEWKLIRYRYVDDGEDGVEVISVTDWRHVSKSVAECLNTVLEKGLAKFHKRWADVHILALESATALITAERLSAVLQDFEESEFEPVDLILLIDGGTVSEMYTKK